MVSSEEINEAFVVLSGKSGSRSVQNHYLVEFSEKANNSEKLQHSRETAEVYKMGWRQKELSRKMFGETQLTSHFDAC